MRLLGFERARARLRGSELARNTLWMTVGNILRTAIQALYFVLLARSLRPDGYGAFISTISLALVAAPFASLGSSFILIKHVARAPERFPLYWANAIFLTASSGVVLLALSSLAAWLILPASIPMMVVLLVGGAELIFARFTEVSAHAFIGFRLLKWSTVLYLLLSFVRLAAVVVLAAIMREPSAAAWGVAYIISTAVAAIFALLAVRFRLGVRWAGVRIAGVELSEGLFFAISQSAQSCHNYIDKSLLSRISGVAAAGVYGVAYRIIDVAFTPLSAMLTASYARYFQRGAHGLRSAVAVSRKLVPVAWLYATVCAAGILLCAPLLPAVLGETYREATDALRWLAPIPLLRVTYNLLGDALSGAGYQRARCIVQVLVVVANISLNLLLLPVYSWRGAAGAALACDALLCVGLLAVTLRALAHEPEQPQAPGAAT